MDIENALPELAEEPQEAREGWRPPDADEVIYRLGLACEPVPGLPSNLAVGDVDVAFVHGPVRAQQTFIRQRFGMPVIFDKSMRREDLAANEVITLLTITSSPPETLEAGFAEWRPCALSAAGMLAAVLDERVAGTEVFEDAILFHKGEFVGAADIRGRVRTYLPFEVNPTDQRALDRLAELTASESSPVARAARLYRRAALEGPTADAYAMLWVAAECFSEHRSPSRKDIEEALKAGGLDPDGLPISIGRLIDLRGKILHHGVESDDRLTLAFYEMEAVVRTLIRQEAEIEGGWWPAADNPAGFSAPFDAAVAAAQQDRETQWHKGDLPPVEIPTELRVPRRIANPHLDPRLEIDPRIGASAPLLAAWVLDAIEWIDPEMSLRIDFDRPPNAPSDLVSAANAERLWLSEEIRDPATLSEPEGFVGLVWELVRMVGVAYAQRIGIESRGNGVAAVEAMGAWLQYLRLVKHGEFPAEDLAIPTDTDLLSLGKLAGWAAAGDARALARVEDLKGDSRDLATSLLAVLAKIPLAAPVHLLDGASAER
jgi:hypothetical protein